jgi:hypothetical protein
MQAGQVGGVSGGLGVDEVVDQERPRICTDLHGLNRRTLHHGEHRGSQGKSVTHKRRSVCTRKDGETWAAFGGYGFYILKAPLGGLWNPR